MPDDVIDQVTALFTEVVGTAPTRGIATTPDDVEDWDSLTHIRLVYAIEQKLGLILSEDVLTSRTSFSELVASVRAARP